MSSQSSRHTAELARVLEALLPWGARIGWAESSDADAGSDSHLPATWGAKRRREHLAGRSAARQALTCWGCEEEVGRDSDGVPVFPSGFSGSITHTGRSRTRAFALVLPCERGVGIDAEEIRPLDAGIAQHVLRESERVQLVGSGVAADLATLAAFSAKESFYKCVFPRVRAFVGFLDVDVSAIERAGNVCSFRVQHRKQGYSAEGLLLFSDDLVLSACWDATNSASERATYSRR